ncbi:hypothetical protein [Bosea sp. (in: a-proteobacteria)]|uniref:hypothetical protein n=1 Tax=Bosea sp. (in: a-proteobacteria) TaxID=1871050 RepID=UPI003340DEF3
MTYVLNNADVLPVPVIAESGALRSEKPGLMRRIYDAIIESRMRTAARELRARNLLVNEAGIVLGGIPFTNLSNDAELPFNR